MLLYNSNLMDFLVYISFSLATIFSFPSALLESETFFTISLFIYFITFLALPISFSFSIRTFQIVSNFFLSANHTILDWTVFIVYSQITIATTTTTRERRRRRRRRKHSFSFANSFD